MTLPQSGRMAGRPAAFRVGGVRTAQRKAIMAPSVASPAISGSGRGLSVRAQGTRDGQKLDRKLRVAVVGGGPAGACTADELAKGGVETFMFERKMDNCKV